MKTVSWDRDRGFPARPLENIRLALGEVDALIANPETDSSSLRNALSDRARLRRDLVAAEDERYWELNGFAPSRERGKCKACDGRGHTDCTCDTCDNEHTRPCESCGGAGHVVGEIAA